MHMHDNAYSWTNIFINFTSTLKEKLTLKRKILLLLIII